MVVEALSASTRLHWGPNCCSRLPGAATRSSFRYPGPVDAALSIPGASARRASRTRGLHAQHFRLPGAATRSTFATRGHNEQFACIFWPVMGCGGPRCKTRCAYCPLLSARSTFRKAAECCDEHGGGGEAYARQGREPEGQARDLSRDCEPRVRTTGVSLRVASPRREPGV